MRIDTLNLSDRVTLSTAPASPRAGTTAAAFDEVLKVAFQDVDRLQKEANQSMQRLAVDGSVDIHHTMIAMEKADLSFRLMLQIRNKLVEAYQEVMRMQV
jgi:flagellar hook-basal body complex protein FliE